MLFYVGLYVLFCFLPLFSDFDALNPEELEENTRLGFHVSEKEFGISPPMTVKEMLSSEELDSLSMVMYLSQFQYQLLQEAPPSPGECSVPGSVVSVVQCYVTRVTGQSFAFRQVVSESRCQSSTRHAGLHPQPTGTQSCAQTEPSGKPCRFFLLCE